MPGYLTNMKLSCKNDEAALRLRAAGLRRTRSRRAVLAALEQAGQPLSHARLAAAKDLQALDRVTLYRALASLEAARLIHTVRAVDGTTLFCANPAAPGCPGGHAHFQCLGCQRTLCLLDQPLPRVILGRGFSVQGKQLIVFGRCPVCARPAARAARKPARVRSHRLSRSG